jgi:uncharacterized membrane protein YsdA (DUF1294 family)
MPNDSRPRFSPHSFHALVALVLTLLLAVWVFLTFPLPKSAVGLLTAGLVGINIVTFGYYGYDKWRARMGSRRVPERVLHGMTILGGSLAAYFAMRLFRHKTIKTSFRVVFWTAVAVQIAIVVYVIYRMWKG